MKKFFINFCLLLSTSMVSAQIFQQSSGDPDTYYSPSPYHIGIGVSEARELLQIGVDGFTFHSGGNKIIGFNYAAWDSGTGSKKLTSWMHSASIQHQSNGNGHMQFRLSETSSDQPNINVLTLKQDSILIGDINRSTDAIVSGRMLVGDPDSLVTPAENHFSFNNQEVYTPLIVEGKDKTSGLFRMPDIWQPSIYVTAPNKNSNDGIYMGYKDGEATISSNLWGKNTLNLVNVKINEGSIAGTSNYPLNVSDNFFVSKEGTTLIGMSKHDISVLTGYDYDQTTIDIIDGYRLYVKDGIRTEKVKVDIMSNWGDFVFDDNYNLNSLEEVENYIITNKHLPEIPSADELESEGLNLGEMQRLQMIKIEELTLHLIEINKEKNNLKSENQLLKEKLDKNQAEIAEVKAMLNQLLTTK